jgi:hypothetical protein
MRHILSPRPVTAGTLRMGNTATAARLVALSGRSQLLSTGDLGTAAGTIDMAAIAAAADEHLRAATRTQKETSLVGVGPVKLWTWTKPATSEILPPHSCSARCGAWRRR